VHHEHVGNRGERRNGCKGAQRIVAGRGIQVRIDDERRRAHQQGVAVGRGFGDRAVRDIPARAQALLGQHLLAERGRQLEREQARHRVGAARKGQKQADRLGRIALRGGERDGERERCANERTCRTIDPRAFQGAPFPGKPAPKFGNAAL